MKKYKSKLITADLRSLRAATRQERLLLLFALQNDYAPMQLRTLNKSQMCTTLKRSMTGNKKKIGRYCYS